MTEVLTTMINDYKNKGERVDEVLFQEVMKNVERVQELDEALRKKIKAFRVLQRREEELNSNLNKDNERNRETLAFYAQHDNWWTYPVPGGYASAATVDNGRRARKELEESK